METKLIMSPLLQLIPSVLGLQISNVHYLPSYIFHAVMWFICLTSFEARLISKDPSWRTLITSSVQTQECPAEMDICVAVTPFFFEKQKHA